MRKDHLEDNEIDGKIGYSDIGWIEFNWLRWALEDTVMSHHQVP